MCGIAGVLSASHLQTSDQEALRRMNAAMAHRGPNDEGFFFDDHVGLAMRRLSIIDLAGGHQPLQSLSGDHTLVCNGEIYNYLELKNDLASRGVQFQTQSDVESILHLYGERGLELFSELRGMFALALWDRSRKQLVLARDRFGEKPLYYHLEPSGKLWFASEMKALLAGLAHTEFALSAQSAHLFLTYQYVPEPATMFEGIYKLPAAHYLCISPHKIEIKPTRYWSYGHAEPNPSVSIPQLRRTLEESVALCLRSDVDMGVALSGGIDSSMIAAMACQQTSRPLKAFSIGYAGRPATDERSMAQSLARQLKMDFYEVEIKEDDVVAQFPELVWSLDDPIGDIAALGFYSVSQLARQHQCPVLLSGLGADELFWGYEWVRRATRSTVKKDRFRFLPDFLLKTMGWGERDQMIFFDLLTWNADAAKTSFGWMTDKAKQRMAADDWTNFFKTEDWSEIPVWLLNIHNETWLTSNCLVEGDRTSMAHSIEMRLPFLDSRLTELVTGWRRGGLQDWKSPHKWLLLEAIGDLLPEEIVKRKKQGFTPPVRRWMGLVIDAYSPLLKEGMLVQKGILDPNFQARWVRGQNIELDYRLCLLEVWIRLYCGDRSAKLGLQTARELTGMNERQAPLLI